MPTARAHAQHALAVYAEPLVVRRRVVVFGEDETLGERVNDLGARQVILVRPGDPADDLRSAAFDLALVADLGEWEDPEPVLARARRLVGEAGALLVAAANRDAAPEGRAFDYYELFDLVARHFADVRMIARMGFDGVALAELGGDGESPSVSVDTQLVEEQRVPEGFVALASERGAALDPYAIVEVPPEPHVAPPVSRVDEEELAALRAELAQEKLRADALVAVAESTRAEAEARRAEVESRRAEAARVAELERELAVASRALAARSEEIEPLRRAAQAGAAAIAQVDELARRADRAERILARVEPELARVAEAHAAELAGFEQALRERAQAIRQLEAEAARRDRMVRELVSALEEQGHGAPAPPVAVAPPSAPVPDDLLEENARLRERLDALALELARREGELQAAAWKNDELERRAPSAPARAAAPPADSDLQSQLTAALDELDALRRALTQEHEQRVRAEEALKPPPGADAGPAA